jgi:SSS family solute:Na+ symporter
MVSILFALWLGGGHDTVIELVNKIGSAFYGPVAAVFVLGILSRRVSGSGALLGLAVGVAANLYLWLRHGEQVSWMWWNLIGWIACMATGLALGSGAEPAPCSSEPRPRESRAVRALLVWFLVILLCGMALEWLW